MLDTKTAIWATFVCAAVTFFTRVSPFLLFKNKVYSDKLSFVQKYIPPMTMVILLVYCFKDAVFLSGSYWFVYGLPIAITAILHLWKRNALISIFTGTLLHMFFLRL